jgi:predicted porin
MPVQLHHPTAAIPTQIRPHKAHGFTWGLTLMLLMGVSLFPGAGHTQTNVTLYGSVDAGFGYTKHSSTPDDRFNAETSFGMISGGQSGNRFGMKGLEDLGNGQAIKFQLENGFNIGNGVAGQSQRIFGRQSWLGYENRNAGQLLFGRQNNFASDYSGPLTPFTGQYANASLGLSFGTANAERLSNLLKFETADLSGFKFGVGYSFATGMTSGYATNGKVTELDRDTRDYNFVTVNNLRSFTSGVKYTDGPLYITLTYDSFYPDAATAKNDYKNANAWIFGGAYDFKILKLSGAVGQTKHGAVNTLQNVLGLFRNDTFDNTNSSIIFDNSLAITSTMIAISSPATSMGQFFAAWQMAKPSSNMQASSVYPISTQRIVSAGYTYPITKRTSLYSYAGYGMNASLVEGLTSTVFAVGMTHKF